MIARSFMIIIGIAGAAFVNVERNPAFREQALYLHINHHTRIRLGQECTANRLIGLVHEESS